MADQTSSSTQPASTQSHPAFALPAECLIADAESLRAALIELISNADAALDASAVQRIDTACLQVLAAFANERRNRQLAVRWTAVSAELARRAALLALDSLLALPEAAGQVRQ